MELKGKAAIVTGASKGIGKAITQALLEKGVRVAGWSRSAPDIHHPQFTYIKTDISKMQEADSAFEKSLMALSNELHILINNAGLGFFAKLEDITPEQWHQMFNTNVHGLYYVTRKAIPLMKAQQLGHIVNIASIAGLTGIEEATGYCATKFAVRGISQSLFKELRKHNIKVTSICPGSVNTEFFNNVEGTTANETMIHPEDLAASVIHLLETPDNFLPVELEVRPLNVRYN
ncbi:MAG: short-chain dehydrogenase [Chitinophagales bacterium]|nr:MAG: short-chain dehydrogenase [Chitinophagales bacterium]